MIQIEPRVWALLSGSGMSCEDCMRRYRFVPAVRRTVLAILVAPVLLALALGAWFSVAATVVAGALLGLVLATALPLRVESPG